MTTKDALTATVTGLNHEGRGIAHLNGKTLFVRGALPGETVDFRYIRRHRKFDEAVAIHIQNPHESRIAARCPHDGICGGCSLQHLAQDKQLVHKTKTLQEQLEHIAKIEPQEWLEPLNQTPWGYRHKARLGVRYVIKKERVLIGFREINGRFLADLQQCEILHPRVGTQLPSLSELIANLSNYRDIPQIEVAAGDEDVALVFRHMSPFTPEDLASLTNFGEANNFLIFLQPKGTDSIHCLWPDADRNRLAYSLPAHDLKLQFHPSDFTQVNLPLNRLMIDRALALLDLNQNDQVLDLFCGLGNFSLPIARYAGSVVGIEGSAEMVSRATENAKLNEISHAEFYCADLYQNANFSSSGPEPHAGKKPWYRRKYSKILLDPPRTGALAIVEQIDQFKADRVVYVSCNPATLARDSAVLVSQHGYELHQAGIIDMFPHTSHVEAIALFVRP